MDFVLSFVIGFVGIWVFFRIHSYNNSSPCQYKECMNNIAKIYGSNKKISKELKEYSLHKIRKGNYEYVEVIDTIKRQNNDRL